MKGTGFSPYIDVLKNNGAEAADPNQLLTDGLKPIPFNAQGF
jgi:hypothetical protein